MRHRRWLLIVPLFLSLLALPAPANGEDPLTALQKAQQRQQEIESQRKNTKSQLTRVYLDREEAKARLEMIDAELVLARGRLAVVQAKRRDADSELKKVEAALKETEAQYEARKGTFGVRLRAIQKEGRVNYLAVLFQSATFGEFIDRMDALKRIVGQDKALIDQIRAVKQRLDVQRRDVMARRDQLAALEEQEQAYAASVQAKLEEAKRWEGELKGRQAALEAQLLEYEKQAEIVEQQIWEYQRQLNRKAGGFAPIAPLRSRLVVTSRFGPRPDPFRGTPSSHGGVDFAANVGDPVYAIEDGLVIHAGWDDIYGNRVVIDHGNGVASWYGHNSEIVVKVGQEVAQGQLIAKAGSTGYSTGAHLHLEIRIDNVKQDPLAYLKQFVSQYLD